VVLGYPTTATKQKILTLGTLSERGTGKRRRAGRLLTRGTPRFNSCGEELAR